ncbi:hypothetical protein JDN40_14340 [Rhodomicrobium vannielii ATCC 17100]|uniref:hypothetical protein n=1 Tax=Rhodomicrobium vannielii TaxID=1069 RepID=UPI00191AC824|nr:hypothetical protein [Rhodomicrobium vannielii]MBJ7535287.1 hypothetical protein [Rhodomicrobium vannielii ATCC 17100]
MTLTLDDKRLTTHSGTASWGSGSGKMFWRAELITDDAPAAVETAGYFAAVWTRLQKGTIIQAVMSISGTPVYKNYIVTASSASGVTVAVATAAAAS